MANHSSATPRLEEGPDPRQGLVRSHREALIRYFRRKGVPGATAEDLAQDSFTRLFALGGHDHIDNVEAYLFRTAASVFTDHVRRNQTRSASAHVSIDDVAPPVEVIDAHRVLEGKQAFATLQRALLDLKPKTREIFLLNRLEGLTYTQIAVRYGLTPSAIEKHMIKALAHLHQRLEASQ